MRDLMIGVLALVAVSILYLPTAHADVGSLDDIVDASPDPGCVLAVEIAPSADAATFETLEGIARSAAATPGRATLHPDPGEHSTATGCVVGVTLSDGTFGTFRRDRGAAYRRHPTDAGAAQPDG